MAPTRQATLTPTTDRLQVTYRVTADPGVIDGRAQAIAVEQSVEMPLEAIADPWVRDHVAGRVDDIRPEQDSPGTYLVTVALSTLTIGDNPAQLLSMLFGNVSLQSDVELVDVDLPASVLGRFAGPGHGPEGLRRLAGPSAAGRPLTCTALKPQGSAPAELATLCRLFADAGIDVVKDDHGLADQATAPFAPRVRACQQAVVATGALYAPSLVGPPRRMAEQLGIATGEGVRVVLVAPMVCGLPAFYELASEHPEVVFLGHPAFGGATRMAPGLLFGKLFRLYGADAVIFPNYGGRFAYAAAECAALADAARRPWHGLRPALPVPAGGMSVERVPEMIDFYGPEVMLLISGSVLRGPDVAARARQFVAAVNR